MKGSKRSLITFFSLLGLSVSMQEAQAAACNSLLGGNWNSALTWSCGHVPTAADDVTVANNMTVTVNAAGMVANSVAIATGNRLSRLQFNAGTSLTVGTNVTINVPTSTTTTRSKDILVNAGTLIVNGNVVMTGAAGTVTTKTNLGVTTGTITIAGGLTINSGGGNNRAVAAITNTGTINVNGTAGVVNGDRVNVGAGTFNAAAYSNSSATIVAATTISTGSLNVAGNLTNAASETITVTGAGNINEKGNWINDGTFTAGTGTVTFNGTAAQSIGGAAVTTFNNLTISNAAAAVAANTNFNVNTTLTVNASAVLSPAAAVLISDAGAGTITGAGTVEVTGTGAWLGAGVGDFVNQYTFTTYTLTNLTVSHTGAAPQTISAIDPTLGTPFTYGSATGGGLKISNLSGVDLAEGSVTVGGTLWLAGGNVTTAASLLSVSSNCPASVSRTSGYVIGNLELTFPTAVGITTCNYPVGDNANYYPVSVALTGATTGSLTGRVDSGDHPDTVANISRLDQTKSANHFWTLTAGTLATYTSYDATLQFCAGACTNAERDATANVNNFIVAKKNAGAWIRLTSVGAATSTQATGVTSAQGFGEFAVGEPLMVYKGVNQLIDLREVY